MDGRSGLSEEISGDLRQDFAQCPMFPRWGAATKSQVIVLASESLRNIFRHTTARRPGFCKKSENSQKKMAKSSVSSISPGRKASADSLQCRTGVFIDGTE
ncbi:MAG TPA: hypothetical protein VKJ77_27025, partial [Caballeronia sp.]|nr:hypothetical protein [Caballeronia sp.]